MLGGVGLVGLGFGMTWPLLVVLASELFGTTHLGTNYMFFNGICGGGGTSHGSRAHVLRRLRPEA